MNVPVSAGACCYCTVTLYEGEPVTVVLKGKAHIGCAIHPAVGNRRP